MNIGNFPHKDGYRTDSHGAKVYDVEDGISVLACDPMTGVADYYPVQGLTIETKCRVQEVTIDHRKVTVSTNESLVAFDTKTGGLEKITPEQGIERFIPVFKKNPMPMGTKWNRDFGWWVGAFISDGWLSGRTVGYTKMEDVKRSEFVRIARDFHPNFTVYKYDQSAEDPGKLGPSCKIHLNSASLAEYIDSFGFYVEGDEQAALRKRIPVAMLMEGSEEFLWGLLSGLLDGDGTISIATHKGTTRFNAKFCTSSPYLRDSVLELCYRLGLRFSVTTVPPRNWSKESYIVCLSTVDMHPILGNLSVVGARERELLEQFATQPAPMDRQAILPLSKDELDTLLPFTRERKDSGAYSKLSQMRHKNNEGICRYVLERYRDVIAEYLPNLLVRLDNRNTLWCRVQKVTTLNKRTVYDLIVENAKVFCTNLGIIIQDTMVFHVPTTDAACKEAVERLLPSKNLISARDFAVQPGISKDNLIGLYEGTRERPAGRVREFASEADVVKAYRMGMLSPQDTVRILK